MIECNIICGVILLSGVAGEGVLFLKLTVTATGGVLWKKDLAQVFSSEFCEIFENTFFKEHLWKSASKLSPFADTFQKILWIF